MPTEYSPIIVHENGGVTFEYTEETKTQTTDMELVTS